METQTFKYLKPESYYSEIYDRGTVRQCRFWEKGTTDKVKEKLEKSSEREKAELVKAKFSVQVVVPTALYFIKGERYAKKASTIREWMENDRLRDENFKNTQPPEGVYCLGCGAVSSMSIIDKSLHTDIHDYKKDRVTFMYECGRCNKRRIIWESGEKWELKITCEKCGKQGDEKQHSRKGNIITTAYHCQYCGHMTKEIWDMDEKIGEPEKPDPDFGKDRERFCLSKKEGDEYVTAAESLRNFSETMKEIEAKQDLKEKVADIKKLNIADLTTLLNKVLENSGYGNLEFSKPETGRDVIMGFTAQDHKTGRAEYDSIHGLKKILKTSLADTNWRLMSEGIYYKLGILSSRLRGYDNDEDLLKLKDNKTQK